MEELSTRRKAGRECHRDQKKRRGEGEEEDEDSHRNIEIPRFVQEGT